MSVPAHPRSSSSRKNGFPPVRWCSCMPARNGTGRPVAAASSALVSATPSRSSQIWVTACRRSRCDSRAATGLRGVTSSGRYVPTSRRGPGSSAMRSNRAALSESAQCRSSKTTTARRLPIRRATRATPACSRSTALRPASVSAASRSGSAGSAPSSASSSSSYGRPSEPGSGRAIQTIMETIQTAAAERRMGSQSAFRETMATSLVRLETYQVFTSLRVTVARRAAAPRRGAA